MGARLALRLEEDPEFEHVAGLDVRAPREAGAGLQFIEADIRDPGLAAVLLRERVDTVVHNQIVRRPGRGISPREMHDINVIGSLQLLAACEQAPGIETIVIRGSAGIYGAEPRAPQFFGEEMAHMFPMRTRFQRDIAEIENYFGGYSRRHPHVCCTMLRYQPAIGPQLDTQITRYLSLRACPTYMGFDPRLQLVHHDDALDALVAAIKRPLRGAVNVAGPGTVGLTRMIRLAGRQALPIAAPLFDAFTQGTRRLGMPPFSDDFRRLLRHGRAVDTSRLENEIGFKPRLSTLAATEDWVRRRDRPELREAVAG
jgi:UDP-glucose 4-epimerase